MKAWMMDLDMSSDQRLSHQREPEEEVDLERLAKLGVLYWRIDPVAFRETETEAFRTLERICSERKYQNRDEIVVQPETLPDYENKIKMFYAEHMHEDEEIRFVIDGSGYFDIRDEHVRRGRESI